MPITRSATKALRVSIRRHRENLNIKNRLKDALRNASKKNMAETFSAVDKAVKFRLIHKNKAGRLKKKLVSRLGLPEIRVKTKITKSPAKTR